MEAAEKLLTDKELVEEASKICSGFKLRTVKTLRDAGKIPVVRLSARMFRYRLESVMKALARLEKSAVTTAMRKGGAR